MAHNNYQNLPPPDDYTFDITYNDMNVVIGYGQMKGIMAVLNDMPEGLTLREQMIYRSAVAQLRGLYEELAKQQVNMCG